MRSIKQQMLSSVKWNLIGTVVAQGTMMVSSIIVARLLQPADYGLAALAITAIAFFSNLAESGFGQALIARPEVDFKVSDSVVTLMLGVGLMAVALLQILARPLAGFYVLPNLELALRVASVGILPLLIVSVPQALLQKQLRFDAINKVTITSVLLGALAAMGLAISGFGFWALILPVIFSTFVKGIGFFLVLRYCPQLRLDLSDIRATAHFGVTILIAHLAKFAVNQGTFLVLGKLWPLSTVGLFQFARDRSQLPFNMLVGQYSGLLFPAFTYVWNERTVLKRAFLDITRLGVVITLPLYVLIIGLAPQLIPWIFGPQWEGAVGAFQIAAAFVFVGAFGTAVAPALYACRKPEVVLYFNFFRLVEIPIIVGCLLVSGLLEVVMGGAIASLIVVAIGYYRYCYRWLGVTWREFVYNMRMASLASVVMMFVLLSGRSILLAVRMPEHVAIAIGVLAAGGLYFYLTRADIRQIGQMLRQEKKSLGK